MRCRYRGGFRQRVMIIHREKSDRRRYSVKSSRVEKSRLQLNVIHTAHATIRLKISGAVIAPVHSVVVALARYVTELVDSIRRGISTVEERTREKGNRRGGRWRGIVIALIPRENKFRTPSHLWTGAMGSTEILDDWHPRDFFCPPRRRTAGLP